MTQTEPRNVADLTARARIRDAALSQFAERGVSGATIRGIAEAAGVSPGLVQHHFGAKEELRRACDEYAIETIKRTKLEALRGGMSSPGFMPAALNTALPIQRYLARALVDGSPGAARLFDDAVDLSEELLKQGLPGIARPNTSDLRAYAAVMTAMNFGLLALHEHLSRALGACTLTAEGYPRMALAMVDILADDLMSPELVEQMRTVLRRLPDGASGRIPTSDAAARKADSDPPA